MRLGKSLAHASVNDMRVETEHNKAETKEQ